MIDSAGRMQRIARSKVPRAMTSSESIIDPLGFFRSVGVSARELLLRLSMVTGAVTVSQLVFEEANLDCPFDNLPPYRDAKET